MAKGRVDSVTSAKGGAPGAGGVVLALTSAERALFFGDSAGKREPAQARWLDPSSLDAGAWARFLATENPEVLLTGWSTPPLPEAWVTDAACRLRYVCHLTGSVRRLVPRVFLERGGLVTNWGSLAAASVAEQALLLALAALRDLGSWRACIERRPAKPRWDCVRTRPLRGARVGIHGFGGVARHLVELLRPFQVSIRAYSAGVPEAFMREHGVEPRASLEPVFQGSDIVFECEALTPATAGRVTAALLASLPDDAVFVNVGRGRVVDEEALAREAASGRIRVAIDVVSKEPIRADEPLCRIPGVIVSPHIGGPTVAEHPRCAALALENLDRFLRGDRPQAIVTLEAYDRAT